MIASRILRAGFRRGVLGGSRPWLVAFGVAGVVRLLQRGREPEVVFCEELADGETLVISRLPNAAVADRMEG